MRSPSSLTKVAGKRAVEHLQHPLRRPRQHDTPFGSEYHRPVDEDWMEQHGGKRMSVSPASARSRPSSAAGVPLTRSSAFAPPTLAATAASCCASGGVFRYSTTTGSTPVARIIANVLRDVPQAGLCQMVTVMRLPPAVRRARQAEGLRQSPRPAAIAHHALCRNGITPACAAGAASPPSATTARDPCRCRRSNSRGPPRTAR